MLERFSALAVLIFAGYAFANTTEHATEVHQMEFSDGTSVEAKYSLPSVNISVDSANETQVVRSSLARVLDFYNTELLAANWGRSKSKLSNGCQKDIETYIAGLSKAENWALKSELSRNFFHHKILLGRFFQKLY